MAPAATSEPIFGDVRHGIGTKGQSCQDTALQSVPALVLLVTNSVIALSFASSTAFAQTTLFFYRPDALLHHGHKPHVAWLRLQGPRSRAPRPAVLASCRRMAS